MSPFSLEQPSTICPFSHLGCQMTFENIRFRLGLPPVDTGVLNGLLMLQNSLNDFAVAPLSLATPGILAL